MRQVHMVVSFRWMQFKGRLEVEWLHDEATFVANLWRNYYNPCSHTCLHGRSGWTECTVSDSVWVPFFRWVHQLAYIEFLDVESTIMTVWTYGANRLWISTLMIKIFSTCHTECCCVSCHEYKNAWVVPSCAFKMRLMQYAGPFFV